MKIQWLQDSNGSYSYARVAGFICIICNLIWRLYMGVSDINNIWQAVVGCSGFLTSIFLWLIEIFRKLPNMSVKLGDKEYSLKKEKEEGVIL